MSMPLLGSGTPYRILILEFLFVTGCVGLIGCAASQPIAPNPTGKALLGKSKQDLVTVQATLLRKRRRSREQYWPTTKKRPRLRNHLLPLRPVDRELIMGVGHASSWRRIAWWG